MPTGHYRFRRSLGNVSSNFRGARPDTYPRFTGLLDTYSGAAAAYSLRVLSSGWIAGDVVEVRRSSDSTTQGFTASQITNGDLVAFCGVGDGFVSTWYDQSGNGNNATQATTTSQPKIVDAGSLVTGGLDFDGVNDSLSTGLDFNGPYTSFSVNRYKGANSTLIYGRGDGVSRHNMNNTGGIKTAMFCGGTSSVDDSGDSTLEHISTAFFDGVVKSNNRVAYNGNSLSSTGSSSSGTEVLNDLTIGAELSSITAYGNSLVNEFIIYPSDEQSNVDAIRTNINDYYSIY
jgi:hypothetical protein